MNWYQRLKNNFFPPKQRRTPPSLLQRIRLSADEANGLPLLAPQAIAPPPDHESVWRVLDLDARTLSRMSPADLMEMMVDISPEISRAIYDFLRMVNPDWECNVYRLTSDRIEKRGQAAVDDFFAMLKGMYGSADIPINRLIFGGWLRGGLFAELVVDRRQVLDLATPDPYSARFKKIVDPKRGEVWKLGQLQNGRWVDLSEYNNIKYIPLDPLPNSPYGRSMAAPALFLAIFSLAMLHDLRRVIQQQGYPRIDIEIKLEALLEIMPKDISPGSQEFNDWILATFNEIKAAYAQLEPEDAYAHLDNLKVNRPIGTLDASSLGSVDKIFATIEIQLTRALKATKLSMEINESSSETHANRQWELHAVRIGSFQTYVQDLLESLLQVLLQAQGIQGRVEFRFGSIRASEELRYAQTEAMKIANAKAKRDEGWITQDEASQEVTGHEAREEGPIRQAAPPEVIQGDGDGMEQQNEDGRMIPALVKVGANGKH